MASNNADLEEVEMSSLENVFSENVARTFVKVKKRKICANTSCNSTENLELAPMFAWEYLDLGIQDNCHVEICHDCREKAELYRDSLVDMIKNGVPLSKASKINLGNVSDSKMIDVVEDSDEEEEEYYEKKDDVYELDVDVETFVEEMMSKFSFDSQYQDSMDRVEERYSNLKKQFDDFDVIEKNITNSIKQMTRELYAVVTKSDDKKADVPVSTSNTVPASASNTVPASPPKAVAGPVNVKPKPKPRPPQRKDQSTPVPLPVVSKPAVQLPPATPFIYEDLKISDEVYVMRLNLLSPWELAKITMIKNKGSEKLYTVRFNVPSYKPKSVPLKHIAYGAPSPVLLSVGARVVAQYMEESEQGPIPSSYYGGIIAEPPTSINNYRYLVFFDDGYAQYCTHQQVVMVCQPFDNVSQEIHPVSRSFITNYLQQYPERAMVRLHPGQTLKTEWGGQWFASRVEEVDASLVRIVFLVDKRREWIYRGSTRLQPLYETLANAEARKNQGAKRPTHNISTMRKNAPFVEYTRNVEEPPPQQTPTQEVRAVARKSTSKPRPVVTAPQKSDEGQLGVEHRGRCKDVVLENPHMQRFEPHQCGPACVEKFPYKEGDLKGTNPLTIPLRLGWARIVAKQKTSAKRSVFYQAPCGRRLRNMAELHRFLRISQSELGIDLFCFEAFVHCFREFEPLETLSKIKDITYGKENVAVSCVNSIDRSNPEYVSYTTERIPRDGVTLNNDPSFLVCCDCTDDCKDKTKCACWQLTIQATEWGPSGKINRNVGYQNRRLLDGCVTGIYECNSGCSCKSTCMNRVAQRPMQLRLQVFKTEKRGWGIRCLDDIPKGTFICVYAGQILTDEGANVDGQAYGDEYLAELDHIEVMERMKEGYESEVEEDPDANEPSTSASAEIATNKSKKAAVANTKSGRPSQKSKISAVVSQTTVDASKSVMPMRSLRAYYGKGDHCFIMDAKSIGNIGRYLNHSCAPNVFVQNVFIDTQDLRFPWVAFFAGAYIRAGKELTWDYSYDVGSVPGKILYCQCGSKQCRGRLL